MKTLKFLVAVVSTAALVVAIGCSSMKTERTSKNYDAGRVASSDTTVINKSVETTTTAPEPVASAPAPAYTPPAEPAPAPQASAPAMSEPVKSAPERVAKADRG